MKIVGKPAEKEDAKEEKSQIVKEDEIELNILPAKEG